MFQLYKKRNFNFLISDAITFLKVSGKNYFKNYFIINGGLLLILIVLCFVMGKIFFESLFSGMTSESSAQLIEEYFDANTGFFIGTGVVMGILILLISIINYSYPVIYLSLVEKYEKPDAKQIIAGFKSKIGRIVLFFLLSIVTFVPIAGLVGLFSMLMIVIIVGIPIAIMLFAAFSCWVYLSLFDYLNTQNSYFESMGNGWKMLFQNFWPHMGSTAIFYLIIYIIQSVLTFIPYMIGLIAMIATAESNNVESKPDTFSTIGILMLVIFTIYIVLAYVLGNVLMISQGMIYYSCKEQVENKSLHNEIDLIGSDFE